MTDTPADELRRDSHSDAPVPEAPTQARPGDVTWAAFTQDAHRWRADAALAGELAALLPDTTDDLVVE